MATNKSRNIEIVSEDPYDYIKVALAIETLAYHNMNYLDKTLNDPKSISEEIQFLLTQALEKGKAR